MSQKYKIVGHIGSGTFGTVYSATRTNNPSTQIVALKLEPQHSSTSSNSSTTSNSSNSSTSSTSRLKKEAAILEYMQSATRMTTTPTDVPTLFWFGKFNNDYGLAMTYFPGISAADCMCANANATANANANACATNPIYDPILFLQSAIDILAFLFKRRIVHRDIKPSHFIYSENRWKLIDFGLANYVPIGVPIAVRGEGGEEEQGGQGGQGGNAIVGNVIVGNLRYASVRSHQGCAVSMCDDAISVGYIAFEWITGELPWQHQTDYAKVKELKETTNFDPLTEYFATCMIPRYMDNVYFGFSTSNNG